MDKKRYIGIGIFIVLVVLIVVIKTVIGNKSIITKNLIKEFVATGGGKEDFISDEEVNKILNDEYGIDVVWDTWSNGKTISKPLIREYEKWNRIFYK